jgi:hypothetical protein
VTEISTTQALEILNLAPGTVQDEIERRFRALAVENHPDHGGSAESFATILAARDRLREDSTGSALARVGGGESALATRASSELAAIERTRDALQERQRNSEQVTKGLVRAEVSRLTRSKRSASFLAWLGGGAGALTLAIRATGSTAESYIGFPWVGPVLIFSILLGAACAIGSFSISDQISRIEQAIEDAAETMSSRSTFLDLLYEIVDIGQIDDLDSWTKGELVDGVSFWSRASARRIALRRERQALMPRIARIALLPLIGMLRIFRWFLSGRFDSAPSLADLATVIGPDAFTRLLIAKGEETGLLVAEEEIDDGRLLVLHRLVVEPAARAEATSGAISS